MNDGTLAATLTAANFVLNGFAGGQGASVTQTLGTYDSAETGSRMVTALLGSQNFAANTGTLLANYLLPASAFGPGLITPAVLTNAPTLAQAISGNMSVRNMASAASIASSTAQAVFAVAVPRTYIPYPSPSTLSTWQNNGFGSLPTVLDTSNASAGVFDTNNDRAIASGPPVINTTEQILLQGGKGKSWHITLPPVIEGDRK